MAKNDRLNADEQAGTDRSVPAQTRVERSVEWERVEQTSAFKELVRKKKAFIIPAAIIYFVFFMAWPSLGGLTTVLDRQAVGPMTWASVYGFALFVMVLVILHLYIGQAKEWDKLAEEARREVSEGRTDA